MLRWCWNYSFRGTVVQNLRGELEMYVLELEVLGELEMYALILEILGDPEMLYSSNCVYIGD